MMKRKLMFIALSSLAVSAFAAVSAEEAKQLGTTLTAFGAEKAGNKDGTIPEYTGEPLKAPLGYDPVNEPGIRPDPFANEKPLYTITAQNAAKYADKLDGWIGVFKQYPDYRMDVYPTHRTVNYPKYLLDNSIKNGTSCHTTQDGLVLEGCHGGVVFPIPKTGAEAMWNHTTAYQSVTTESRNYTWVVPPTSDPIMVTATHVFQIWPIYDPKATTPFPSTAVFWKVRSDDIAPARKVGENIVLIDYVDSRGSRRAWSYIPGQRRVKLAPDLSYDTPGPWQGGYATMDDGQVFLGPIDRFDWKLIGKKEKLIEYNNFKAYNDPKTCPPEVHLSTKHFPNPACSRWELHRVWVVEATIKPQYRHIYHKSIFYWDEDFPGQGAAEHFDAGGKLFRLASNYYTPFFNGEGNCSDSTYYLDLNTGGYATAGIAGGAPHSGWWLSKPQDPYVYTAEAMAAEGVR